MLYISDRRKKKLHLVGVRCWSFVSFSEYRGANGANLVIKSKMTVCIRLYGANISIRSNVTAFIRLHGVMAVETDILLGICEVVKNISGNLVTLVFNEYYCPVSWGCRIHRLILCRRVRPHNECPGYNTKQSDGEVSVMLELWRILLHCHRFQVHSGPEWEHLIGSYLRVK